MNIEDLRNYCLSKPGTEECFPFDETTLVFKVGGKMFALTDLHDHPPCVNLKCDSTLIEELRARYACVTPGYHMNKNHWNTVIIDGSVSDAQVCRWIDDSYNLVLQSLPKKSKSVFEKINNEH